MLFRSALLQQRKCDKALEMLLIAEQANPTQYELKRLICRALGGWGYFSKAGRFIGCSNYPACSFIENIVKPGEAERLAALKEEYEGKPCPAGGTIVVKNSRFGPFLASSLYPEVKWIGKIPDPKLVALQEKYGGEACTECGKGVMTVKSSRRGPFLACSNYPDCKNAKNLPKEAKNAEGDEEGGSAPASAPVAEGEIPLPPDPFG